MRISPVNNYQTNNRKNVNFGAVKGDCETILTIANRIGVDLTHPYEPESALIGLLDEAEIALLGHNHPKVYYPMQMLTQ